jgi:voltage-gated potassium channel
LEEKKNEGNMEYKLLFQKGEFKKRKLYIYLILNLLVISLLIISSKFHIKEGFWGYFLFGILLLILLFCIYLLIEFIIFIPTTNAKLSNICIGSSLLLSLIILTYANLFHLIYLMQGHRAFKFTGKHLDGNDFVYYSITTFTTTGFGDITSIGLMSNILAGAEMLLGMLANTVFMAIITAKLIKNLK